MSERTSTQARDELLSRYVDDDLSEEERRSLEELLEADGTLREELADMREVVADLGALERPGPPRGLARRVGRLAELEAERSGLLRRSQDFLSRRLLGSPVLALFAVVLAMCVILYVLSEGVSRTETGRTRLILTPSEPAGPEVVEAAGRRFARHADGWREEGLDPGAAATAERLTGEAAERVFSRHPELTPLRPLDAPVLLSLEGTVTWLEPAEE